MVLLLACQCIAMKKETTDLTGVAGECGGEVRSQTLEVVSLPLTTSMGQVCC